MTVIRLDAATLAQFEAATGEVILADENGKPVRQVILPPVPTGEPDLTEAEWAEIENDPISYSLAEAWEKIRRGEKI
ncbi:hypothetical protein R5W23_001041 [Gemmata sp. JC673]|uniref:Prevent-host-death protein n=1 Tax=Gemmata algarum TaxID=2975278 RepID=A0ABU5EX93_9BACT|nr:hypothetical protein [Gemmata algarum]MDY3559869.1 hypothetical protein [Gemmata algarum]